MAKAMVYSEVEEEDTAMAAEDQRAVFVDTSLDTHLAILVSPLHSFSSLKQQILVDHSKCFPEFGEIKINALKVKHNGCYYHLPDTMLLRTIFHGIAKTWFVFADVSIPVDSLKSKIHYEGKPMEESSLPHRLGAGRFRKKFHKKRKRVDNIDANDNDAKTHMSSHMPNILYENVAPSDKENIIRESETHSIKTAEEGTVMHIDSKLLLRQHQPLIVVEREKEAAEDVACLKPLNMKGILQSGNAAKKRRKTKIKTHVTEEQDLSNMWHNDDQEAVGPRQIGADLLQPTETSKPEDNVATGSGKLKKRSRNRQTVASKDPAEFPVNEQLDEKMREMAVHRSANHDVFTTSGVSGAEYQNEPDNVHRDACVVAADAVEKTKSARGKLTIQSSVLLLEDGGDSIVKDVQERTELVHQLEDTSTSLGVTPNKESGIDNVGPASISRAKKTKKTKKPKKGGVDGVHRSHALNPSQVPDILHKGLVPSDNENVIHESEPDSIKTAEEVSALQLNNNPKLLLPEHQDLTLVEREKETEKEIAPLKLDNTGKKSRTSKAKSSVTENHELSSKRLNDDIEADRRRQIDAEFLQPVEISKPEGSVEIRSGKPKMRSQSRKTVSGKDPSEFSLKEQLDEKMREMAAPGTADDALSKKSSVNGVKHLSNPREGHHVESNEIPLSFDSNKPQVTKPKAKKPNLSSPDGASFSERNLITSKKSKESERTSWVGTQLEKDVQEAEYGRQNDDDDEVSQHEVEREMELHEDVTPLKSENTARKRKTNKTKSSVREDGELSSKRQNDDQETDDTRQIFAEFLKPDEISKPQGSAETRNGKPRKRSQNRKAVPRKDPSVFPWGDQFDVKMREMAVTETAGGDPLKTSGINRAKYQGNPGKGHHEESNEIHLSFGSNKPRASKQKEKKPSLRSPVDTSSNGHDSFASKKSKESVRTSQVGTQLANDIRDAEYMRQSGDEEELSQQKPMTLVEREKESEEEVASLKSENTAKKRKTIKARSFVTENQEFVSKRQNDDQEAHETGQISAESLQTAEGAKPDKNVEIKSGKLKNRSRNRQIVSAENPTKFTLKEQLDEKTREMSVPGTGDGDISESRDMNGAKHQCEQRKGHHKESNVISIPVDKPRSSKQKANKLTVPSSVDTSSNGQNFTMKMNIESERTSQDGILLPSDVQELEYTRQSGAPTFQPPQVDKPDENVEIESDKPKKRMQKKPSLSAKDLPKLPEKQQLDDKDREMEVPKTVEVEQADHLLTNDDGNDAEHQSKVAQGEGIHDESSEIPLPNDAEVRKLERPLASKKSKKLDRPSLGETSSNGLNLIELKNLKCFELQKPITEQDKGGTKPQLNAEHSTISQQVDSQVSPADPFNSMPKLTIVPYRNNPTRESGVSHSSTDNGSKSSGTSSVSSGSSIRRTHQGKKAKEHQKKLDENHIGLRRPGHKIVGEVAGAAPKKKGWLATSGAIFEGGSSSSSDDEDERDGSSSSTRTPSDNLSSDYSEGQSKGDAVTSHHDSSKSGGRNKTYSNSSALKNLTMESILRSSSRYRKAKLVASQSQTESQPDEFVPDSQANL